MKTRTEMIVTTTWHNLRRAFFTAQVFAMTLAVPVLFYIGLTHDVKASRMQNEIKTEQGIANTTSVKSSINL